MTTAQVVETSVTNNSLSEDYSVTWITQDKQLFSHNYFKKPAVDLAVRFRIPAHETGLPAKLAEVKLYSIVDKPVLTCAAGHHVF